jgi:MFS family permease
MDALPSRKDLRLVVFASSLGTIFEWYDFFIYGTLAFLFGKLFFPPGNETAAVLLALATFGVGFAVRPLGAFVFGFLGDRFGRKYTFLVTITLMALATAGIGLLGTYAQIGIAAPILLVTLRALQGLALGGEYGGAAIYVAEHAPDNRRGALTGWIQIGATMGFVLSLLAVLGTTAMLGEAAWNDWGWRLPFLYSLPLLGISLWVRLKLRESPVFQAMRAAGEQARNPIAESFDSWPKVRRLLAVLLAAAGQSIVGYVALFQAMNFLLGPQHMDQTQVRIVMVVAALLAVPSNVIFGALSDRVGRRPVIAAGFALMLLTVFPAFHLIAQQANPALARATAANPVVVTGHDCRYNPFAQKGQATACGAVLDALSKKGVAYTKVEGAPGAAPQVSIGGTPVDVAHIDRALAEAGYSLAPVTPPTANVFAITFIVFAMFVFSGLTYGPIAAWMVELFPARIRYTSLSVPYHVGVGYFSGFMPFIVQYIVALTGDLYAGLWYPFAVVALALLAPLMLLPETAGKKLD